MEEKEIVFSTDADIIRDAVGEVINEKDYNMKAKPPRPWSGGLYDPLIFGLPNKCACGTVTSGRCPVCHVQVVSTDVYNKRQAFYQLHIPFCTSLKLRNIMQKFELLNIPLPKTKTKLPVSPNNQDLRACANLWSLAFIFKNKEEGSIEKKLDDILDQEIFHKDEEPLAVYDGFVNERGEKESLFIYEINDGVDIKSVGAYGLQQFLKKKLNGESLKFLEAHINSVIPIPSPGTREAKFMPLNEKIVKVLPPEHYNYANIIHMNEYVHTYLKTMNKMTIDQATLCFLMNELIDQHIKTTPMMASSKSATFRKNIALRTGKSMRGNAVSYKKAKIGELYMPRSLSYHCLQAQIIQKIVQDQGRHEYDAYKLYYKMDPIAIRAFEDIVEHAQVLLLRNPSLHRNNIMQFKPILWSDDTPAIGANPFVCKSYNLDFDGDQLAIYWLTDPEEIFKMGNSLKAENIWVFDKSHEPAYLPTTTTVYGLYAATKIQPQPEGTKPKEFDSFERMEKAFDDDKIEVDELVKLLPNKLTTYGREKVSKIFGLDINKIIGESEPLDLDGITKITLGLQGKPNREEIVNKMCEFGDEIATLMGIANLPLRSMYKNYSSKIDAILDRTDINDTAKIRAITEILPEELDKHLSMVPDSNIDILMKGARIKKPQLRALYNPYVRFDENGEVKVGDSTIISGLSEEEYVTAAHGQRAVLEIKGDAVPRAGYNRQQIVSAAMDIQYKKVANADKSYVYFPQSLAKNDERNIAYDAPKAKYDAYDNTTKSKASIVVNCKHEPMVPVYSTALSSDMNIYKQQVSRKTDGITKEGAYLGIAYADSMAEVFYQAELGLKYGGLLNDFSGEDILAVNEGKPRVEDRFLYIGDKKYLLGTNIVPSEKVDRGEYIKVGDKIAINANLININKRFASFYTLFKLQVADRGVGNRSAATAFYNMEGINYIPFDGTLHYQNKDVYLNTTNLGPIVDKATYFFPDGYKAHFGERFNSLTLDLHAMATVCDSHYLPYLLWREFIRISGGAVSNTDLADVLYKVLTRAKYSIHTFNNTRDDDWTQRLINGFSAKTLKEAVEKGINQETMETSIPLPKANPILQLLLRVQGTDDYNDLGD